MIISHIQDDLMPASLGDVSGYGRVEVKEAAFGDTNSEGVFAFDTFDTWTLKNFMMSRTRCEYRGLWVQDGQRFIATAEIVVTDMGGDRISFRTVTPPSSLKPI